MIYKARYSTSAGQAALPALGTWVSDWFDNGGSTSELLACIAVYSDVAGNVDVDQTDAPDDPKMTVWCQGVQVVPPGQLTLVQFPISHLYWRVDYSNCATAQTLIDLVITASASENAAILLELQRLNFQMNRLINPYTPKDDVLNLITGQLS